MTTHETAKELFFKGLACLDQNDFAGAETFLERTLELAAGHLPSLNNLAVAQFRQNKFNDAALTAGKLLQIDGRNLAAYSMLLNCQIGQQDFEAALKTSEVIVSIDPAAAEQALLGRAHLLADLDRHDEAIAAYDSALRLNPDLPEAWLGRGNALSRLKRYQDAIPAYDNALVKLESAPAWLGRGNALSMLARYDEAIVAYDRALSKSDDLAPAWLGRGNVLNMLERHEEAAAAFDRALTLNSDLAAAWLGRGNSFSHLGRYDDAIASFAKALDRNPDLVAAWLGTAHMLAELKRHDEALSVFEKALTVAPDLADALVGRAGVLVELRRHEDALATYDKALVLDPDLQPGWFGRGNVLTLLKRQNEALEAYDKILIFEPGQVEALLCRANLFLMLHRYDEALAAYERALTLGPDLAEAHLGRGNLLFLRHGYDEAMASYNKALSFKPDLAEAHLGRGNILFLGKQFDDAFLAYDKAFSLRPDLTGLEGARLHSKMQMCDWRNFGEECQNLIASIRGGHPNASPFILLSVPGADDDHMRCAKLWVTKNFPLTTPSWQQGRYDHDRIRVAYLSADFGDHPTSYLTAGLFENHDRKCFEVTAISFGIESTGEMRKRLVAAFDRFFEVKNQSDEEIAKLLRTLEIDIAVDMMGHTTSARPAILANRPAPIQVSYLAYPGTTATDFIDYLIADPVVIPPTHRKHYIEKVAYLPNCYQVNDRKRAISARTFTRAECGLPEQGFVFCCFNNTYKITPAIFDGWMRILTQVKGSSLWLLEDNASATANLRREAAARGVEADRLVFAGRMPLPEHLARHRCADLFLDTLPYNAHTTTSDALWTGLPVLTHIGEAFAGRVAASLLNAIGLTELITHSQGEYEKTAIDLANNPAKLATIKDKLAENRLSTPLFNTRAYARDLEAVYLAMHARFEAGLPPDHIQIPES